MHKGPIILALATAMVSLSGCQLFSPGHGSAIQSAQAAPDMASYFDQRLADGRRHLQANRLSSAITAYRQASYSADHTADAYNGLAIAFDRLGRRDLAEHYFDAALALAPQNAAIARNLARFEARHAGPERTEALARHDAPAGVTTDLQEPQVQLQTPAPVHGLVRTSDGALLLRARDDRPSRATSEVRERPAVVHVGRPDRQSVASAGDAGDATVENGDKYPIRVQIAEASTQYPVRVRIGGATDSPDARLQVRRGPPNGRSTAVRFSSPRG